MMSFLVSTTRRSLGGFVPPSARRFFFATQKTPLGGHNNNVGFSCLGHRFLSSSTGRQNNNTAAEKIVNKEDTVAGGPFEPPPPSTAEEQEALKQMYEELQKMKDVLVSEVINEDPFATNKLPEFPDFENLTEEQEEMNDKLDELFISKFATNPVFAPDLMLDLFGKTNPLDVDPKRVWADYQKEKDLAENEYFDEEDNLCTFHPPHTLNDQNSFIDEDGDRCHFDDIQPEHCLDSEGDLIPHLVARFHQVHKEMPEFYPKKKDFTKAINKLEHDAVNNQWERDEAEQLENVFKPRIGREDGGLAKPNEGETALTGDDEDLRYELQVLDEFGEIKDLEEDDEEDEEDEEGKEGEENEENEEDEEDEENEKDFRDDLGFTPEERELMESDFYPGYRIPTQEYLNDLEKTMQEEEEEDADEIAAEQEGSEERTSTQNDDEYSDDGTFELNKFVTDRKVVVGNNAAASSSAATANTNNSIYKDQENLQEFYKVFDRLGETFVRSLTEPGFKLDASVLDNADLKSNTHGRNKKDSFDDLDFDFDDHVKKP